MSTNTSNKGNGEPGKNIVVAADKSPAAFDALTWSIKNMYTQGDTIHLVHCFAPLQPAVGPHFAYVPTEGEQDAWRNESNRVLEEFADKAKKLRPDVNVQMHLVAGDARDHLVTAGEKYNANSIVIGSRGLNGLKRAFLGSVSSYLAHNATRPVTIVRPRDVQTTTPPTAHH
eukprot:m.172355 g.172355  ORF g.172355 m.172355 type:complete len:172 (+) comp17293_c0_seq1:382-897(+)